MFVMRISSAIEDFFSDILDAIVEVYKSNKIKV